MNALIRPLLHYLLAIAVVLSGVSASAGAAMLNHNADETAAQEQIASIDSSTDHCASQSRLKSDDTGTSPAGMDCCDGVQCLCDCMHASTPLLISGISVKRGYPVFWNSRAVFTGHAASDALPATRPPIA